MNEPVLAVFATMVETVLKSDGSPCFNNNVTVPEDVGLQVMSTELPAVKPEEKVVALNVKGLAWAETRPTRALMMMEVENCMVRALCILFERSEYSTRRLNCVELDG